MIAIDTNILVRLLVGDNQKQAKKAADVLNNNRGFISKSVLIETEWVLRYTYKIDQPTIISIFNKLFAFPKLTFEDPSIILQAISWNQQGLDFADALHLASSDKNTISSFITFDQKLTKRANKINTPIKVELA